MAIKIIHTADWHLGHMLHNFDREQEHQAFLDWLIELIKSEQADALLVAGDIFETANPSACAWKMLYVFLAKLYKEMPALNVILLGGNHDSPSKLNAPHDLLKAFSLHMLGSIQRDSEAKLKLNSLLVPIFNKTSEIEAWVMAVPFLRTSDLRIQDSAQSQDRLINGVENLYQEVFQAAKEMQQPNQALIATGHLYMASTKLSELSERRILGGNQHALPASIFNEEIDYVALGHLHLAQKVVKQERIRYSGSPIPLSFSERRYQHQVLCVEFNQGELTSVTPHFVPRKVDVLRMPEKAKPLKETLEILKNWQVEEKELACQPLVEIPVLLNEPEPMLRAKILAAIENKPIRLAKITPQYQGAKEEKQNFHAQSLSEVTPFEVFCYGWQNKYADKPPQAMLNAFDQLMQEVEQAEEENL